MKAVVAIAARDKIGEAPIWDAAAGHLFWVDHAVGVIHEARKELSGWRELRRRELNRPVAAAIPRTGGGLVLAAGTEILLLDEQGPIRTLTRLEVDGTKYRINEAKCDAHGHLWFGTLSTAFDQTAALYRLGDEGEIRTMLSGVALANGFDWSPDGHTLYFIDTLRCQIEAYEVSQMQQPPRVVVRFETGAGGGNGLTVDADGCLWVALTGGGEVRRYTQEGKLLQTVSISVPGATSCTFAGVDLEELMITSRSGRMPEIARSVGVSEACMESHGPDAGALFSCHPGVRGRTANAFAG
jgi:sugar lactone lactonase YvrE